MLLKGPQGSPKTKEEAIPIYKSYLGELDEKSTAFLKEFPTDPRRWQLKLFALKIRGMRSMVEMEPVSEAAVAQGLSEIMAAPDADVATKGFASFLQVMAVRGGAWWNLVVEAMVFQTCELVTEVQFTAKEEDSDPVIRRIVEPSGSSFQGLDLTIEPLTDRIGNTV